MNRIPPLVRIGAWLLVVLIGAAAVALGWDRGPDPLIDFGRELYVPWQLTEGAVLHDQIAWFNGPLGPWLIEGWMRLFGVSLDALQALNAVIIALAVGLLALLLRVIADEFVAWLGALVFLCVFAVAQQEAVGNFLFLAPYSHGITFGFVAGLGALAALSRATRSGGAGAIALAGVCTGLAFLTKAEMFLGVGVAAATMLGAIIWHRGQCLKYTVAFGLGCTVPIAAAAFRFASQIGWEATPRALAGTWPHAMNATISDMPFYRMMRGTFELGESLQRIALTTVLTTAFVTVIYALVRSLARRTERAETATLIGLVAATTLTVLTFVWAPLKWMLLPLVIVLPLLTLSASRRFLRVRGSEKAPRAIVLLGFTVFALALTPKVLLVPLARQYGFVLSVPGTMLLVALFVRWIPLSMGGPPRAMAAARGAGVGLVLVFAAMNANATRNWYAGKVIPLGSGTDKIMSDGWRGSVLVDLKNDLETRLQPGDQLLMLPEGITINYLLRRTTPTRLVNFMPPELAIFGEDHILSALEANPPAVVVLLHRPTEIYGPKFFGQGYGERTLEWVQTHYRRARLIGDRPFDPEGVFGAEILVPAAGPR